MKKCIRCQVVIGKKLRPGGGSAPPPAPPAPHGPAPGWGRTPTLALPEVLPQGPAPHGPPALTETPSRRRHGGAQRGPRTWSAAAAGGGAAEPLPADGGAHHLPHLHRQPHPPRVPVRPRRVRALRSRAQRLPHLPPAHPRPHPDLRLARASPSTPRPGRARLVPAPRPATSFAGPYPLFYKKMYGLFASGCLPAVGPRGPPPAPAPAPFMPLIQLWGSALWPEVPPGLGQKGWGTGPQCRPGAVGGPKPPQRRLPAPGAAVDTGSGQTRSHDGPVGSWLDGRGPGVCLRTSEPGGRNTDLGRGHGTGRGVGLLAQMFSHGGGRCPRLGPSGPSGRALSKNHPKSSPGASRLLASHLALTPLARRATVTLGSRPGWRTGRASTPGFVRLGALPLARFRPQPQPQPPPPPHLPSPQSAPPRGPPCPGSRFPQPRAPSPASRLARLLCQALPEGALSSLLPPGQPVAQPLPGTLETWAVQPPPEGA